MNYKIIAKYVHGSENSNDIDVHYVFQSVPDNKFCYEFCNHHGEDRNIIVVENGVVVFTHKGRLDEVNNGLIDTYCLHEQIYDLIVNKRLKRDVLMKQIGVVRFIIGNLTRTSYRKEMKQALKGGWNNRLNALKYVSEAILEIEDLDKIKGLAYQVGQVVALQDGFELYTKNMICDRYPNLCNYINRKKCNPTDLIDMINTFYNNILNIDVSGVDIRHEKYKE